VTTPFSIVVPLFNKASYVTRCIHSILAQTHSQFEVVVVDDGSTDGGAEIVREIPDDRIKVVTQENQGVSAARNRGIAESQHELVAFLDADDWWDPDYLTEMARLVAIYPDVSLYFAEFAHVEGGVATLGQLPMPRNAPHVVFDALEECALRGTFQFPFYPSSVILRRHALAQAGGFDPHLAYYEDYDLFLRICIASHCAAVVGRALVFYNDDVPVDRRAKGRLFPLERSLVGNLDKFDRIRDAHPALGCYIDRFRLFNLMPYVEAGFPAEVIRPLLRATDRSRFSWKHTLYYSYTMPGKLFVLMSIFRRRLRASLTRLTRFAWRAGLGRRAT